MTSSRRKKFCHLMSVAAYASSWSLTVWQCDNYSVTVRMTLTISSIILGPRRCPFLDNRTRDVRPPGLDFLLQAITYPSARRRSPNNAEDQSMRVFHLSINLSFSFSNKWWPCGAGVQRGPYFTCDQCPAAALSGNRQRMHPEVCGSRKWPPTVSFKRVATE